MVGYKGRRLDKNLRVRVYRNLHKGGLSLVQKGLVVAHCDYICLENVKFIVSESGRKRVRLEARKNVHAFVEGIWSEEDPFESEHIARYNPYTDEGFHINGQVLRSCSRACVYTSGVHCEDWNLRP